MADGAAAGPAAPPPLLEARGIDKSFPGVRALQGVSLRLQAGEVLALIGENGAGKSTLMKILAGVQQPDAGELRIDGRPVRIDSPARANQLGVALIHQELSLCDNLTVAGALFLGRELARGPFLRRRAMARAAAAALQRVGLDAAPDRPLGDLSPGQRQLVEIARALEVGARVLIMDEPTSSLGHGETERLFAVVRQLAARGVGVIYISHRLGEVQELAQRVVALRDGRNAGELTAAEASHARMAALMVGRELAPVARTPAAPGPVVLELRALRTRAFPRHAVDLQVRAGEIVGIAGLLGSGRSELLRAIFGADPRAGGTVAVLGRAVGPTPRAAIAAGLALVPEDRKEQGLLLSMSVRDNLSLPSLRPRGPFLHPAFERGLAAGAIAELRIVTPDADCAVGTLSGGNQQKVVLGKWLATGPRALLLDEPTRGIDVGSRAEIHARLRQLARSGLAVLFASSELEEVLALADRILVLRAGAPAGELAAAEATEERVMLLATDGGTA